MRTGCRGFNSGVGGPFVAEPHGGPLQLQGKTHHLRVLRSELAQHADGTLGADCPRKLCSLATRVLLRIANHAGRNFHAQRFIRRHSVSRTPDAHTPQGFAASPTQYPRLAPVDPRFSHSCRRRSGCMVGGCDRVYTGNLIVLRQCHVIIHRRDCPMRMERRRSSQLHGAGSHVKRVFWLRRGRLVLRCVIIIQRKHGRWCGARCRNDVHGVYDCNRLWRWLPLRGGWQRFWVLHPGCLHGRCGVPERAGVRSDCLNLHHRHLRCH